MLIKIMPPGDCSVTNYKNNYYRFDKVMYSHDLPTIDLTKSCIHVTYHKSRHYLTLMTVYQRGAVCLWGGGPGIFGVVKGGESKILVPPPLAH